MMMMRAQPAPLARAAGGRLKILTRWGSVGSISFLENKKDKHPLSLLADAD